MQSTALMEGTKESYISIAFSFVRLFYAGHATPRFVRLYESLSLLINCNHVESRNQIQWALEKTSFIN